MKLLDVNVVLPAHRDDHPDHAAAREFLDMLLASREQFWVPWTVWWSFLRLATHPRIFAVPTPHGDAFSFIHSMRSQPGHVTLAAGSRHLDCLRAVCEDGEAAGDLVPDAALAALAVEHACEVVSFDRDFARFPNIRWHRPQSK